MISVTNLSKKYRRFIAVDNVSFDVQEGEVLGFLGPNGAGKTTTMRMITGYVPPSQGRVRIGGNDLYDRPLEAKRLIGYLPENPPLYAEMTVRSYLRFVGALKDVPASRLRAAVDRAIERTRLDEVADRRISRLSKGFKQRVGLAQALVHEPPVLILDEPTSSLDPKQRTEVRELIAQLKGQHTVLLSTHILPEVAEVADRVVIIDHGKVMAVDTPEHLSDRLRAREVIKIELFVPDVAGDEAVRDLVRVSLAALPRVTRVDATMTAGGTCHAVVETPVGVDVRSEAAALVIGLRWKLLSLASESLSLEEIFLSLTGDGVGKERA